MSRARNLRRAARKADPVRYRTGALLRRTELLRWAMVQFRGMTPEQAWAEVVRLHKAGKWPEVAR